MHAETTATVILLPDCSKPNLMCLAYAIQQQITVSTPFGGDQHQKECCGVGLLYRRGRIQFWNWVFSYYHYPGMETMQPTCFKFSASTRQMHHLVTCCVPGTMPKFAEEAISWTSMCYLNKFESDACVRVLQASPHLRQWVCQSHDLFFSQKIIIIFYLWWSRWVSRRHSASRRHCIHAASRGHTECMVFLLPRSTYHCWRCYNYNNIFTYFRGGFQRQLSDLTLCHLLYITHICHIRRIIIV